jgi:hypothetical protein
MALLTYNIFLVIIENGSELSCGTFFFYSHNGSSVCGTKNFNLD